MDIVLTFYRLCTFPIGGLGAWTSRALISRALATKCNAPLRCVGDAARVAMAVPGR